MYYLLINGQKTGPYSPHEIRQYLHQGAIGYETQFWQEGMMNWTTIQSARHLFENSAPNSYQQPPQQNQMMNYYQPQPMMMQPIIINQGKSRAAYILLGLFLGGLGIHNFYAGYAGRGIAQLLLNLYLWWTIIVPIGITIWVIIEVITTDRDSNGFKMI